MGCAAGEEDDTRGADGKKGDPRGPSIKEDTARGAAGDEDNVVLLAISLVTINGRHRLTGTANPGVFSFPFAIP